MSVIFHHETKALMSYIVDSGIIEKLVDGSIGIEELPSDRPFIAAYTHLQKIRGIEDKKRRTELLLRFSALEPKFEPTGPLALGGPQWEQFRLRDGALLQKLKHDVDAINDSEIHVRELLLAEVAIEHRLTLLTADKGLADAVRIHGGEAVVFTGTGPNDLTARH